MTDNNFKKINVSLIIPTRNEEDIVRNNLIKIYEFISDSSLFNKFEIIICDFSKDSTSKIVMELIKDYKNINLEKITKKGIGAGLKQGMNKSKYNIIIFYPIDLAYDINSINRMVKVIKSDSDLVFGSRRCKGASVNKPTNRKIFSSIYSIIINSLFGIRIRDTQGIFCIKKSKLKYFLNKIKSNDGFFQTELAIYGRKFNLRIKEIPVTQEEPYNRESKINPLKEGTSMLNELIKKYIELKLR